MVHNRFFKKFIISLSFLMSVTLSANAVPVHINSGNPAYPFPQFLEYACGGNLGTRNAEGVVHAELEQDVRDAYQIHANEFAYTGVEWQGIKYVETPYKAAYDCTEGDGYGLLACAYMADQVTFNGYWMCTHDKRRSRSKKYTDCSDIASDYVYGPFALGDDGASGNTAADGDVDVALALYVAYKQWGEFMRNEDGEIVNDACGNPISYKQEMINVLRGLVAMSTRFPTENPMRVNSGLIGLDGYPKGGDTWNEQTSWASDNPTVFTESKEIFSLPGTGMVDVKGVSLIPEFGGAHDQHIDYNAPSYFHEFYKLFEELGGDPWEIEQFRRGEASSDWLIGQLIAKNQYSIPTAGWCTVNDNGTQTSFSNFNMGEDYRCNWRTICNYVWHGNPTYSWDPASHKVVDGGNTYEYDAAVKMSKFLNDPAHWNEAAGSSCIEYGDPKNLPYSGPATICWQYDPMTGVTLSDFYVLNCQNGMGSYSAVGAQDYELMGLLYRQCAIEWDNNGNSATGGTSCYLTTKPVYMHGWARHMGMMVLSGNYPAPSTIKPLANMKIYRGIKDSVTYCYTGDEITFLLDYRNYGSVDAEGVEIVENVPEDFIFVSASEGGIYDKSSHTIRWEIGTVNGVKSDGLEGPELNLKATNLSKTVGQVSYVCQAGPKASGRYCTTAEITCTNGSGWVTNEYPNYKTATMQRNCVDVVKRSLMIEKKCDRALTNTDNEAVFSIDFENSSEAGWIDGGRPRVNVSYSSEDQGNQYLMRFRLFNDAIEPYINYGNYRISYYLYDAGLNCLQGVDGCDVGWNVKNQIYEGGMTIGSADGVVVTQENIVEGEDSYGKWNQRICVQFAPLLVTTTMHLARFFGGANCRIHKGGTSPLRGVWSINASNWKNPDWSTHWSYGSYDDLEGGLYYPITPSRQRLDEKGQSIEEPVDRWLTCGCTKATKTVPNILVEEYDGYVWRRILGTGPMAGRDAENVYIRDTLPKGLEFIDFVGECPLSEFDATLKHSKTSDGRDVIEWYIPKMQVKQKGTISYRANVTFPSGKECQTDDEDIINYAWISADKNSPVADTALITVTCSKVPKPIKPTTLTKTADKESYAEGDEIEYTIGYKQTHGAQFNDVSSSSSDWSLDRWTISGGKLSSASNVVGSATYENSNSINGFLEFTCTPSTYQWFTVYMRKNGNSSVRIVLHTTDATSLGLFVYDDASLKYSHEDLLFSNGLPFTMRLDLNEDLLRVWVNKDTTKSPNVSVSGLKVREGVMGFQNGDANGGNNSGIHTLSNINIHTDYAYDLSIIDQVPPEVICDESSFESYHNGVKAGSAKYYKGTDGDSIVWTGLADNPIAFGDTFTLKWKGVVDKCAQTIINIAYAKLMGHADDEIMAQEVSGCGEECPLPNVSLTLSDDTVCAGTDSVVLTAGPLGKYKYQFFEDGVAISDETAENEVVVRPISAGKFKYTVIVTSGTTRLPCYSPSDTVVLVADRLPVVTDFDLGVFCPGNANLTSMDKDIQNMLSDGASFAWLDEDGNDVPEPDVNAILTEGEYHYSYWLSSPSGCKSREAGELNFKVNVISGPTGTGTVSYLLGDTSSNGVFEKNLIEQDPAVVTMESGYTYIWYDENLQPLSAVPTPPLPEAGSTKIYTYYVNRTKKGGCVSDTMTVTVTVSGSAIPVPDNVVYCLNDEAAPISAQLGDVKDSDAVWELVYYDADGKELVDEADRIPNTSEGGIISYFVSQREVGNPENESGKTPLTVTVVSIPQPDITMNRTQYCKGEDYEELDVKSNYDLYDSKFSSFYWSVDGKDVSGVPLAQTQTEVVTYGVVESYQIADDHVCLSDTVKFAVKTTFVPVATGSLTVNYLKQEAGEDGSFGSLLKKDPSLVTPSDNEDYELVWFDENMTEIGTQDPSPVKSDSWKENEDVTLTYFVKQRQKESGCLSDTVRITVVISDALIPNVFPMNYCHHAKTTSLESNASVNTNKGQVQDIDYELVWFSPEDDYSAPLDKAPVPSSDVVGVTIYKVAQKHKVEGSLSSKADVKVTVFPNPEIEIDALPQTCGEDIEISKYIHLANTIDTSLLNYYYFTDRNCTNPLADLVLTESSVFYANAYYTIFSEPNIIGVCSSDTIQLKATIDDIANLVVDAPTSVCPNGDITLKASAGSTTSDVSYEWSGDAEGSGAVLETKDESGVFGKTYSYKVTASAGACHLDTVVEVKVGRGDLTGAMQVNGEDMRSYRTCGGEPITLSTTHEGEDFSWSDLSGNSLGSGKEISVTPTESTSYVITFVNKCETSDTIVMDLFPLSVTADFTLLDTTICERSSASATLDIIGYDSSMDGSYIKWFKDGEELSDFYGKSSIEIDEATVGNSGEYTFEVSNGICVRSSADDDSDAHLLVKPYVKYAEFSVVEVPHNGTVNLVVKDLVPSDAIVSWSSSDYSGEGNPFVVENMENDELFEVTMSSDDYCDSKAELQVLVDAKAVVSITVPSVVCVVDGVSLSADTTGTGHLLHPESYNLSWYSLDLEGNVSKLNSAKLSVTDYPDTSVSYFAVVSYGEQTAVSDTIPVEVVSPAEYTKTENAVSCSGDEVTIEVISENPDVTVVWSDDNTESLSLTVAPEENSTYAFVVKTKDLCPVSDYINVEVKEKPSVTIDGEKEVCEGSTITVAATVTGKEFTSFYWTDPEGEIISRDSKLVTNPTISGDYTLNVVTASCGEASGSVPVNVIPIPVLYVDSLSFNSRRIEVASGGVGAFEYKIDNQDWQDDNLFENLAYKVLHTAYVRDESGCIAVTVFNIPQPPVPIPDYFTPDNSGENEVWDVAPIMEAYPNSTVKIFDRTGKVVAILEGDAQDWDGTYNGQPLPSTDYWYLINVPEIRQQFTGHFTLIRNN